MRTSGKRSSQTGPTGRPPRWPLSPSADRQGRCLAAGVALVAFTVYLLTMPPSLTFEHYGTDGGDLVAAARNLGVPHPTGYPVYTLLAWLFSRLPLGTIAYRVNLMSAACAAVAVGLFCRTAQVILPTTGARLLLPVATALTLAFSSLLWSQAVIAEVYALLSLFSALILYLLVRWRQTGDKRALWGAAFTLGLGLGNHLTLAFVAPAALILLLNRQVSSPHPWYHHSVLLPAAGLFLAGLSIYAYLPLAAAQYPPINWGVPRTWTRFLWVVTGKQYQQFAFGLALGDIPGRLLSWAGLLGDQFGWWGLGLTLLGAWGWWRRDRRFSLFSLAWILLAGLYAFFYDTWDAHIYLLPTLPLLALWWGEGASLVIEMARQWSLARGANLARHHHQHPIQGQAWLHITLAVIALLPLASLGLHWGNADLSHDHVVPDYVDGALSAIAPDGLVVVRGDGPTFALWYGVYAEERRPDVAIVSGPLLAYIWYREQIRHQYPDLRLREPSVTDEVTTDDLVRDLLASNMPHRPVYATDPADAWKTWFQFTEEESGPVYRVQAKTE